MKKDKICLGLNIVFFMLCAAVFLIAFFACEPIANTVSGQSFLHKCSIFINSQSQTFFNLQFWFSFAAIMVYTFKTIIRKRSIKNVEEELNKYLTSGYKKIDYEMNDFSKRINKFEVEFAAESPNLLITVQSHSRNIKDAHGRLMTVYKDNLRNYYECNKKVYKIVRKTQLVSVVEITSLIETYDKI